MEQKIEKSSPIGTVTHLGPRPPLHTCLSSLGPGTMGMSSWHLATHLEILIDLLVCGGLSVGGKDDSQFDNTRLFQ